MPQGPSPDPKSIRSASSTRLRHFRQSIGVLGIELLLATGLAGLLRYLWNGGMVWIVTGMLSGAIVFYVSRAYQIPVQRHVAARQIGQAFVGMAIGFSITDSDWLAIAGKLPVFILLTLFLLLSGVAIGYVYSRLSRTNLLTSMLATVPGGVGIMSSIAADYNRDVSLVSLVQIIRVTSVIVLLPPIARASVRVGHTPAISAPAASAPVASVPATNLASLISLQIAPLGLLLLALLLTIGLTGLARRCKIPAAPFMGSIVAGLVFQPLLRLVPIAPLSIAAINFSPPPLVNTLGQLLLGITIGEYWGHNPIVGRRAIGFAFVSVSLTLSAGFLASLLAMQLTQWDWLTCLLVTAPGGAPEMILVALSLDHQVEAVTTGHLVRLITINATLPLWVLLFRQLDRRLSQSKRNLG